MFIVGSVLFTTLCATGLTQMAEETDVQTLWLPRGTDFKKNSEYLRAVTEADEDSCRRQKVQVVSVEDRGSVLTAQSVREVHRLRQAVFDIVTEDGATWPNRCKRVPFLGHLPSLTTPPEGAFPEEVCPQVETAEAAEKAAPKVCLESHLLEAWAVGGSLNRGLPANLTDKDVVETINGDDLVSGLTGLPLRVSDFLGSAVEDRKSGEVISAKGMTLTFVTNRMLKGDEPNATFENDMSLNFEEEFIRVVR